MNRYPPYLRDGDPDAYHYGTLSYNRRRKCWEIHAEPCVTELAKRLFPGCEGSGRGLARFTAHRRVVGDLNWLMLRYPLEVRVYLASGECVDIGTVESYREVCARWTN